MEPGLDPAGRTVSDRPDRLIRDVLNPRHLMRLKPVVGTARARYAGQLLATSSRALWCLEVGRDFHDPVLYFPTARVSARLAPSRRTTHCPLKGETTYYHLLDESRKPIARDIAWSYTTTYPPASSLQGRIAFDAARVTFEITPQPGSPATSRPPG
jgi:uncharacterized protein (DUF427 family)